MTEFGWNTSVLSGSITFNIWVEGITEVDDASQSNSQKANGLLGGVIVSVRCLSKPDPQFEIVQSYELLSNFLEVSTAYIDHLDACLEVTEETESEGPEEGQSEDQLEANQLVNAYRRIRNDVLPCVHALHNIFHNTNAFGHTVWLDGVGLKTT